MSNFSAFSVPNFWNQSSIPTVRQRYRTATCISPDDRKLTERESEIAAKIASLRRQKKLGHQKQPNPPTNQSDTATDNVSQPATPEESMYSGTIAEAEALFGTAPKKDDEEYKPKVSTWGVFARPKNISRTYGGGRAIPLGGKTETPESREFDNRVAEKLARYRGGSTEEAALEAEHAEEIDEAIAEAKTMMGRGFGFDATRILRPLLQYATPRTRRGGELRLALALACEDSGRRTEAKEIYSLLLRKNRFNNIRRTVKRLSDGFADMEAMRVEEGSSDEQLGFRSEDFTIPLITDLDKPYRTVLDKKILEMSDEEKRRERVMLFSIAIALIGVPTFVILVLRSIS